VLPVPIGERHIGRIVVEHQLAIGVGKLEPLPIGVVDDPMDGWIVAATMISQYI